MGAQELQTQQNKLMVLSENLKTPIKMGNYDFMGSNSATPIFAFLFNGHKIINKMMVGCFGLSCPLRQYFSLY